MKITCTICYFLKTTTLKYEPVSCKYPPSYIKIVFLHTKHVESCTMILRKYGTPVLFADDTSIIISSTNENEFKNNLSFVINETATWCKSNVLTLNLEKTQFMQFLTNHHKKNRHAHNNNGSSHSQHHLH